MPEDMTDEQAVEAVKAVSDEPTKQNGRRHVLTREEILNRGYKPKIEWVPVPEWVPKGLPDTGDYGVYVKEMRGTERDQYELSMQQIAQTRGANRGQQAVNPLMNARARLVAWTATDENGQRVFSPQDAVRLGEDSAKALTRIAVVSMRLSALNDSDLEEMTKDLGEDQSASSGSN